MRDVCVEESNIPSTLDSEHKEDSTSTSGEDIGYTSVEDGTVNLPLKHESGIWSDKIRSEKIMRERKVNKVRSDFEIPVIGINDELVKLDEKKQQPPMIVLSNRLPFVLKRDDKGSLVRKAR